MPPKTPTDAQYRPRMCRRAIMSNREQNMRRYRKEYWQRFTQENKRIYGTLSNREYTNIKAIAEKNGRTVWQQVWTESEAYRTQKFVPTREIEKRIELLYVSLRKIGNNINQVSRYTNILGKLKHPAMLMKEMEKLEQTVEAFVSRPWRVESDHDTTKSAEDTD